MRTSTARTGQNYFYAMEFVEGETLEKLIKRSGRLEVKLALEIATQVVARLAAVHKQKLVHRDIKPSNVMVSMEDGGAVSANLIDLGLAKTASEPLAEAAISMPGAFAGTPEFASPEQFAGVQVDIRSDLYSLGVTLWEMLIGQTPFRGSSVEVMHQHQHAPLPVEQLSGRYSDSDGKLGQGPDPLGCGYCRRTRPTGDRSARRDSENRLLRLDGALAHAASRIALSYRKWTRIFRRWLARRNQ